MTKRPKSAGTTAVACFESLEHEILTALHTLCRQMNADMRRILSPFGLPPPYARALRQIEGAVSMKELGRRLECDPSFVTVIADRLEEKALIRREVDPLDRRVKNLVLTKAGAELREQLVHDFFGSIRRIHRLDTPEREAILPMLEKMIDARQEPATANDEPVRTEMGRVRAGARA
jgi:MarR family transcriptional regulator, organic hydroperoxide resistance regulator